MIVYSGIPIRFRAHYKDRIEVWALDPKAPPVFSIKTEHGEVDLIRHTWGRDIHIAPERETDIAILDKFK